MATEYSLLTWAGLGTTVTFTDAGDVVNFTAHGAPNGHAFRFTTTGTLPTGLTAGTTYYLRQGADANKFVIHPTQADAIAGTNQVTFTGTGSGTHKVVGEYWAALDTAGRARYGTAGSERVYGAIADWGTVVEATKDLSKDLILEFEGKWIDPTMLSNNGIGFGGYKSITLHSKINGVRSSAFHGGIIGGGYSNLFVSSGRNNIYNVKQPNLVVDGLELRNTYGSFSSQMSAVKIQPGGANTIIKNCILQSTCGVYYDASGVQLYNNIAVNCLDSGFYGSSNVPVGCNLFFNIAHNCVNGFSFYSSASNCSNPTLIGNIAIGNTTRNWQVFNTTVQGASRFYAACNFGDTTDIKTVTFENSTTPGTLTCRLAGHTFSINTPIRFKNGGGATAPGNIAFSTLYYIKAVATDTFTLSTTVGGTAIAYSSSGSGTITTSLVWDTSDTVGYVSTSDFIDYANKNFKPALATSPQVELITLTDGDGLPRYDIADAVRPNYEASSFPNNKATAGPFEFDHGEGLAPLTVTITITGMASGSEFAIYKTSDMSQIVAPQSTSGSYSGSYTYTGDTAIKVRVRKGSASTKYLPYEYDGTITAAGFTLNVSQIPDPIA